MNIITRDDVDKFFDKFEDPSHEVERVMNALDTVLFTGEPGVSKYFVKRLIMKSYRLGKEHAYAGALDSVRRKK